MPGRGRGVPPQEGVGRCGLWMNRSCSELLTAPRGLLLRLGVPSPDQRQQRPHGVGGDDGFAPAVRPHREVPQRPRRELLCIGVARRDEADLDPEATDAAIARNGPCMGDESCTGDAAKAP